MAARRRRRRGAALMAAAAAACLAAAVPAFAHASFPGATNPTGTAASPYPAGTQQTIKMNVPFEQDGVDFEGAANTTVDVKVTAPTGWTKAACGDVRTSGYVALVGGWLCTVAEEGGRQVLHWTGAQIAPGKSSDDSAQYFAFLITTPTPTAKTSYGGAGSNADGFRVIQKYADGATATWRTPNDTTGEVANGLVRAVAPATGGAQTPVATASPTASPEPSSTAAPRATAGSDTSPAGEPTAAAIDDDLPHTGGGDVSGGWLVAGSSALALGLVLVASTTTRRRPADEGTRR